MDEADRMIDMGFEEDVRAIMSHFKVGVVSRGRLTSSIRDRLFCFPLQCRVKSKISLNSH